MIEGDNMSNRLAELNLRYMQVEFSLETGVNLPGSALPEFFPMCEFITLHERTESGLICYLRLEFSHKDKLKGNYGAIKILSLIHI